VGNDIVKLLGGREIHPINVKVGGFYKAPSKAELETLRPKLETAHDLAGEMVEFMAQLEFPKFEQDYEFVSLRHPDEYPFNEGRLVSNKGLDIDIASFSEFITEEHVEHSTSLHAFIQKRGAYHVGPLARYNLNIDRLTENTRELARKVGLETPCNNPFKSIVVRSLETFWAVEEALRILDAYVEPKAPSVTINAKAGVGHGCSEAPRGILYHRYELDSEGLIKDALIVPPTSQNQKMIEADLLKFVENYVHLEDDELQWKCEQAVRNYDPCISCSCHFLNLRVNRDGKVTKAK
ncbi:MAG: nickel-dependent hydrogenase large subunit, partial [Verrucomicrobiae bacterium]|nr:nickel-dependent hydrogenase large subunit [Verrucomicrobiae bacterium]